MENHPGGDMSKGILNSLLAVHVYPVKMETESSFQ